METATVGFSAQFGDEDVADVILPHFKALKKASKGCKISKFPFKELVFILRADGSVRSYGFSGLKYEDINYKDSYISIDLGITIKDRIGASIDEPLSFLVESIKSSVDYLQNLNTKMAADINFEELTSELDKLCSSYEKSFK